MEQHQYPPIAPHPGHHEYSSSNGGLVGHHTEPHMAIGHPVYLHFPSFSEAEFLSPMVVPHLDYPPPGMMIGPALPMRAAPVSAPVRKEPHKRVSPLTRSTTTGEPEPSGSQTPNDKGQEEKEKIIRKRAMNAAAAKRTRERKAIRIAMYEETIDQLRKENALLVARNAQLETVNRNLMFAQDNLQRKINALSSSTSSSSLAMASESVGTYMTPSSISPSSNS